MASGKKQATDKDVRFALEHMGERLIRTIIQGTGKFVYTLSPSNLTVPEHVFLKLSRDQFFAVDSEGLFPGMAQSFKARQ